MLLYNMVSKVDPAALFLLPLIIPQRPDKWPRFIDCFPTARAVKMVDDIPIMIPVDEKEKPVNIYILLRIGGDNRDNYRERINDLRSHPNYIADEDDITDATYAQFVYSVPDRWKDDYTKICEGHFRNTSHEYKSMIIKIFPELGTQLKQLFGNS